jgi:hypothetical protein
MVVGPKFIQTRRVCILTCRLSKQEGTKNRHVSESILKTQKKGE